MFDVSSYDHPDRVEQALSFVRTGLLFPDNGAGPRWPSELDVLPHVIAAEIAGSDEPDRERAWRVLGHSQCPIDRGFFDAVFDGSTLDKALLAQAVATVVEHGVVGASDAGDALAVLRGEPLAAVASGMVCDAVGFASGDVDYLMPTSRLFADMVPPPRVPAFSATASATF